MPAARPHANKANAYARSVVRGKTPACKWVRLACQRHLDDLKKSKQKSYPYTWDRAKAERICVFAEAHVHVKGQWAKRRERIKLEPWQCFIYGMIFGWVSKKTGLRRFLSALIIIARKNAKSTMAAILGLYGLVADKEAGAEVFSGAAKSLDQAMHVFKPAWLMADRNPDFREAFDVELSGTHKNPMAIYRAADSSSFKPIIGKPGDGASPHVAIVDEYHEHATDEQLEAMETGMGAREQPLLFVISTAGSNTVGPCFKMQRRVEEMLDGTADDDRLFGIIYTIDSEDDWSSDVAIRKANPNIGVSVSWDYLHKERDMALKDPTKQSTYKTKHLDVWVTARDPWMNMEVWNKAAKPEMFDEDLSDCVHCQGFDIGSKNDLTARVSIYRRGDAETGTFLVRGDYFVPEARVEEPENRHYAGWVEQGYLHGTPGNMLDFSAVRESIMAADEAWTTAEVGFDPWNGAQMAQELAEQGIVVVEVPQRVNHFSEPMKWIKSLVESGRLFHDGNPVLAWGVGNVVAKEDANENIFPRKESKERKIDPATAMIVAMNRAFSVKATRWRSIYEDEDPLVVRVS